MEKPGNKQDEEFEEDWKLLFELYEILKKRVDAREEKMRDYVRKVGLTEKEKNKDEQQSQCRESYAVKGIRFSFRRRGVYLEN